jgi:hypothetical protein
MKFKHILIGFYSMVCALVLTLAFIKVSTNNNVPAVETENKYSEAIPYSIQMYNSIEKYSEKYSIPKSVAYNVAYRETGYRGPFDWNYNPHQNSNMGAVGPMQIITRYAHYFAGRKVTEKELKTNIALNVEISMKMLKYWYGIYNDWTLACGAYNSGKPIRNDYAVYISTTKNYLNQWDRLKVN